MSARNLRIDRAGAVQFGSFVLVIAGLFAVLHFSARRPEWLFTKGSIQGVRIVADHALETKFGGTVTWRADYQVGYAVDGREYSIWTDSGIRGETEGDVRMQFPRRYGDCRVQYGPQKPKISIASCR